MDDDEEESVSVQIDFKQTVNLVRFVGGGILPTKFTIHAEVIPTEAVDDDFDVAFTKIKFWFDTIVSRSVVFCISNQDALDMLIKDGVPRMANHLVMTPSEPTDEHLATLFQSKMQALSDNKFIFGQIKMKSDISNGLIFTYVGSWEDDLPKMADWFSTTPYYFDTPWWTRNDVSSIDMIIGEYNPDKIPAWATKMDFIKSSMHSENETTAPEKESIIIKGSFRPKIINGEKNEDKPEDTLT